MFLVTAVLISAATFVTGAPFIDFHIIGGKNATIEEYPFQVSLLISGRHYCGGSILNERHVLTSIHCVTGRRPEDCSVLVGSTALSDGRKGEVFRIESWVLYDCKGLMCNGDVAVLKLKKAVTFGPKVQPIALVPENQEPRPGEVLTTLGWGPTSKFQIDQRILNNVLQAVQVTSIDRKKCMGVFGDHVYEIVSERMLCAGGDGKGFCHGDYGGPLINNKRELVGIVSWAVDCAKSPLPQVYTNIANHVMHKFIVKHIKE